MIFVKIAAVLFMIVAVVILGSEVHAMKPAPFEDIVFISDKTGFQVISKMQKIKGGYSEKGTTEVLNEKGKVIWSMPIFAGRQFMDLSPNGEILVLTGDFFFGSELNISANAVMATIFKKGKEIKKINFSDLFSETAETITAKRGLKVKGGGWVARVDFVGKIKVDWKSRTLSFPLYDGAIKEFKF